MTRRYFCERVLRQVYNGQPTDDSNITVNLVNAYVNDAIGVAAKQCYVESIKLDGVAYLNNSFYTTFKGLAVTQYEPFIYQITLPQIPIGLGRNEGVASLQLKDGKDANVSLTGIPLSTWQQAYRKALKKPFNKFLYWSEGTFIFVETPVLLYQVTANVKMVSGGLSTDLDSTINVPDEYFGLISDYVGKMLMIERAQKQDQANDGNDSI